ncbi:MFS general substrate transporter [Trichoderma citrinoviride]|uniref:MFS general substrate transporter n=1 Tax=Trichoderma citrinoviride TaxID=58853 RepID=A0A2T4BEH3_9HYPO|nr:MFS general substrate transporter [Trichoderma citrinoviride]PTB67734.1 MFS general substrate transporter [Trichoderma citrinoviride]
MAGSHARSSSNDFTSSFLLDPLRPRRTLELPDGTWVSRDTFETLNEVDSPSSHDFGPSPLEKTPGNSPSGPVTWMSLPRKDQLFILFLSRFVDFLQVASLQAYVFYQLKAFDDSLSDAQISQQAGVLQGCFTGAQVMTAILWGKAADASWCGRKRVLLIGLAGTAVSCLGYGFATTFFWAAFWRAFGGAINGTVGIIRTMIAEITKEKKYQSRAFLLLPMSFNVAGILGPIMGGMLADSPQTLPGLFGEKAVFGFQWVRDYPYALPSLINAAGLFIVTLIIFLFLEETSRARRHKPDIGLQLGSRIKAAIFGNHQSDDYARVPPWGAHATEDYEDSGILAEKPAVRMQQLPFRRLWTRNVLFTLLTGAFYDFHLGAFGNMWSLFLSTPRYIISTPERSEKLRRYLPLLFTGGLGMPASTVGVATSFLGFVGMFLQVTLYPPIQARLGTMRSFRWFLFLFPVAYFVAPYLSILPSWSPPPEPASGGFIWAGIIGVVFLQVMARTFTLPASIILLNNCSPHPSVLGTIHGLGQSVSALFRTVGPVIGGWWYGYGLDIGMVAWGWWGVAAVSLLTCGTALGMHDGSGHEILLEGEELE